MLSGDWSLTHQGIAFYDDGSLADGQHRLNAIVSSGVTVKMQVAYGVPRTSGADIDVHRARDASDAVKIGQLSDWVAKDAIAITRIIAVNGDRLNIREIVRVCESHRDDYQFVIGLFTTRKAVYHIVAYHGRNGDGKRSWRAATCACQVCVLPDDRDD